MPRMTNQNQVLCMFGPGEGMIKCINIRINCTKWIDLFLTQPPLLFNHDTRLLRTNSPMQSTMVCTIAGCPCRTQSTARAPATAYRDTIFPHVTPVHRETEIDINIIKWSLSFSTYFHSYQWQHIFVWAGGIVYESQVTLHIRCLITLCLHKKTRTVMYKTLLLLLRSNMGKVRPVTGLVVWVGLKLG